MTIIKKITLMALPMLFLACSNADDSSVNSPADKPPTIGRINGDLSTTWKGDGTAEKPYIVSNEEELRKIAFYVNDSSMNFKGTFFMQTKDINLSQAWNPIGIWGKDANGLGDRPFSGTYDGNSKTISGLTINDTASYSGLFGLVREAHISNIVIKEAKMSVGSNAGILAGVIDSSSVDNCTVEDADINGTDRVAGLIGEASYTLITGVSVSGSVQGKNTVGGIVAHLKNGELVNLTNNASVTGVSSVGGIVGVSESVGDEDSISSSHNYGAITGTKDVGGIAAKISTIKLYRSGNYGSVTADESQLGSVGGVVAIASNKSTINEVYNVGKVTVKGVLAAGGIIGNMKNIQATNVFNQGELAGKANFIGGLVGIADGESHLELGYNSGKVPDENYSGTVAGKVVSTATVSNIYYDKTIGGSCLVVANQIGMELPVGYSSEEMKTEPFVSTLNAKDNIWTINPSKFDGYPAFSWIK